MAKKLKRVRRSPYVLMFELLFPWIVMGALSVALTSAGVSRDGSIGIALVGALGATGLVFLLERRRSLSMLRARGQNPPR